MSELQHGSTGNSGIVVTSNLQQIRFRTFYSTFADLHGVPLLPGGFLEATFDFKKEIDSVDDVLTHRDAFAVAWQVSHEPSGETERFINTACRCTYGLPPIAMARIDRAS